MHKGGEHEDMRGEREDENKGGTESEKAKTLRIARFLSQKLSGLNP